MFDRPATKIPDITKRFKNRSLSFGQLTVTRTIRIRRKDVSVIFNIVRPLHYETAFFPIPAA